MRISYYFLFILFIVLSGCLKGVKHDKISEQQQAQLNQNKPQVSSVRIIGDRIEIIGNFLADTTSVRVVGPGVGNVLNFLLKAETRILLDALSPIDFDIDETYSLLVTNAHGQANFPFTFTLDSESVRTQHLEDGAVTLPKINSTGALNGQILKFDAVTNQWFFAADAGAGAAGTGTVTDVILGTGLLPGTINVSGTVAVDISTTGDPTAIKIPYFDNSNLLNIDETAKLHFPSSSRNFSVFNDGSLRVHDETDGADRLIVDGAGNLTVFNNLNVAGNITGPGGSSVCLQDGSNCPAAVTGGDLDDLSVEPLAPYNNTLRINSTVGGTVTTGSGTISVNVGAGPNQIVQLDGSSRLPAVDGALLTNVPPAGIAGGSLSGTYPNPTIAPASIGINQLASMGASPGQILSYDGFSWGPTNVAGTGTLTGLAVDPGVPQNDTLVIDGVVGGNFTSGSGTISVNTGTGPNQIVQLDGAGLLPPLDGSQLINLSASNIWTLTGSDTYFNSGNVGIGTTTPTNVFQVETAATTMGSFITSANSGGIDIESSNLAAQSTQVRFSQLGTAQAQVQYDFINDLFSIFTGGVLGANRSFSIDNNQDVIIGSSNGGLGYKLYVLRDPASAVASTEANTLVVEQASGTGAGISILTDATTVGNIYFGDSSTNDAGKISYNHTSDLLTFSTSGSATTALAIDNAGRVGLGPSNTSPLYSFEINDDFTGDLTAGVVNQSSIINNRARFYVQAGPGVGGEASGHFAAYPTLATYPNAIAIETGPSASAIILNATDVGQSIQLHTQTGEQVRVLETGEVGIGTITPDTKLHIVQEDASVAISYPLKVTHDFDAGVGAAGIGSGLLFETEDDSGVFENAGAIAAVFTDPTSGATRGDLVFQTANTGLLTERMRLDEVGNLGLGSISPLVKLHLDDNLNSFGTSLRIQNSTGLTNPWDITSRGNIDPILEGSLTFDIGATTNFAITPAGDVKIGSLLTAPTTITNAKLDISDGGIAIESSQDNSSSSVPAISNLPINAEIMGYGADDFANDGGHLRLSAGGGSNANQKVYIDLLGASSSAVLDKAINAYANKYSFNIIDGLGATSTALSIDNAGDVDIDNDLNVDGSITSPSDIRFKKGIIPLDSALKKIEKLSPVQYYWREADFPGKNFNDKLQYGLIAQEAEKVLPEIVSEDRFSFKRVSYTSLIPWIISAMKELKQWVQDFFKSNDRKIEMLIQRMDKLEEENLLLKKKLSNYQLKTSFTDNEEQAK